MVTIDAIIPAAVGNILDAFRRAMDRFTTSDMEILSPEVKKILSDPEDAKAYLEALEEVKKSGQSKTIKLHNGEELTLI